MSNFNDKTIVGMPAVRLIKNLSQLERAIMRVEHYLHFNLDKETTTACIKYVAKGSGYSFESLVDKMRIKL